MNTTAVPSLGDARAALADEWRAADPQTPADIDAFYTHAQGIRDDLEAWHAEPVRQDWTRMLVHVAKQSEAKFVLDLGCGAGHDLAALKAAGIERLVGLEVNNPLRHRLNALGFDVTNDLADVDLARVDLFNCIDVLEHLDEPEAFLERALGEARIGALLFEATATHDQDTPLHLTKLRGWQPGRWLEQHGWWVVDETGRLRVWERQRETARQTASLLLVAHKLPGCFGSAIALTGGGDQLWRMQHHLGDAMITRGRSRIVSQWYANKYDDVFLMIDDDITFLRSDADRVAELCRAGFDIVCGAYPVRSGEHLALRTLGGEESISFGPGLPPYEIQWAATGFMAVHRRVIEALAATLPIVYSGDWFWPFFQNFWLHDERINGQLWLSEDWGFCELARRLGFRVWLDPQTRLVHEGRTIPLTIANMGVIKDAVAKA